MLLAAEVHAGFRQRDSGHRAQFGIDFEEEREILLNRDGKGINLVGSNPLGGNWFFRSQADIVLLYPGRGLGNLDRSRGRGFDRPAAQIVRGGKSPGAVGDHANANAERFRVGGAADFAILGAEGAAALVHHAGIGVRGATQVWPG